MKKKVKGTSATRRLGSILIREDMGAQKNRNELSRSLGRDYFLRDSYFLVQHSCSKLGNMKYFVEKLYHVTILLWSRRWDLNPRPADYESVFVRFCLPN